MATRPASENPFDELLLSEVAAPAAAPAAKVRLYAKSDGLLYWKDDAGTEYPVGAGAITAADVPIVDSGTLYTGTDVEAALQEIGAHPGDTSAAHAASAVSIADSGAYFTGTDVEAALQELGAGGGGGGGLAASKVGYTTIGGSTEAAQNRIRLKKVTLADCVVLGMDIYLKQVTSGSSMSIAAALLTDNAGTPELAIASYVPKATDGLFLSTSNGAAGAARWHTVPLGGRQVAAGDYWLAFYIDSSTAYEVYKDGSGADRYYSPSAFRMSDAGWTTVTTTTDRYSAYLNILS